MQTLSRLSDDAREAAAARVKAAHDVNLPPLQFWNYSLCRTHRHGWVETVYDPASDQDRRVTVLDRPKPGCRDCGIHFRRHQRLGISWLYLKKRALLADTVGSGKTAHAAGLIAMIKESGELETRGRVVLCVRAAAISQWHKELARMLPTVNVMVATGTKRKRIEKYLSPWDVCLIGPEMLLRDHADLEAFDLSTLIVDDVDGLRNRENQIAIRLKKIAEQTERCVIMTGTPLQKKLHELHSVLEPLGGRDVLGSRLSFEKKFVQSKTTKIYVAGQRRFVKEITGYKNMEEFKRLIEPFTLRRTADDIDDVHLPTLNPSDVILDLYPRQRLKYEELQQKVLRVMENGAEKVKQIQAITMLHYASQICAGLATLGEDDGPQASVKLDWVMNQLNGDLGEEKVVIFARFKSTIRALQRRLERAGIGYATIWGENKNREARQAEVDRFDYEPSCRVMLGTQAIEQSLNLQVARHLINIDMIMNPARMEQLAGRIRRDGSAYQHVYIHNLLTEDTHEERIMPLLEAEQAVIDSVWGENSSLFDALDPFTLMHLIVP